MKILYFTEVNLWSNTFIGVRKKIFAQISCLVSSGMEVYLVTQYGSFTCFFHETQLIKKALPLCMEDRFFLVLDFIRKSNIRFVYIRNVMANASYIVFLKQLRKMGIGVIIEYPSIPYDLEFPDDSYVLREDQYYRNRERNYVSLSTNYNDLTKVYGIPSIPLINGINLCDAPLRQIRPHNGVILLAVATMALWHGYDRLLQGMANYYTGNNCTKEVRLILVGDGPEIPKYRKIVMDKHLESYVEFRGALYGEQILDLYDVADIAIGVLALNRVGRKNANTIKTNEYCARGIPFVIGHHDLSFPNNYKFVLKVPNNEDPISIPDILNFVTKVKDNIDGMEIRKYAEENLTWDITLKPVINYISKYD